MLASSPVQPRKAQGIQSDNNRKTSHLNDLQHLNFIRAHQPVIVDKPNRVKSGTTADILVPAVGKEGVDHTEIGKKGKLCTQATKTGSLCCVAARPHGSSDAPNNWPHTTDKPYWHTNEGYGPPFSSSHLDQLQVDEYLGTSSRTFPTHRRSLSSSSRGSRSWRRADSARLYNHHRTQSGSMFGGSPSNFTWNPLASSSGRIADSMTAESELAASPSTTSNSSKPDHFFIRPPPIPNSSETISSFSGAMHAASTRTKSVLPSPSQANESLFSKSSFLVPGNPLRKEQYEGRYPQAGPGRLPSSEGRHSFHRSSSSRSSSAGGSSDWSSLHGYLEHPHARQEWLRLANNTSPSDISWGLTREGYDKGLGQMCTEKITAGGSQSASPSLRSETCSMCSRLLNQRSPWASSRVMGFHDCSVVGVLVCGHTYHAECLEQITPDSSRQDPACPRCNSDKSVPKETITSSRTMKLGNVRESSFMSRPSSRNKLSRIGVLDDNVSMGRPRFLTNSPRDTSP